MHISIPVSQLPLDIERYCNLQDFACAGQLLLVSSDVPTYSTPWDEYQVPITRNYDESAKSAYCMAILEDVTFKDLPIGNEGKIYEVVRRQTA